MRPFLLVLSSPSGGGKTTIARRLLGSRADLGYSVSATTRAPRPGELDGVAYHFLPRPEFERRVAAGDFLEWAEYGGHLYGTLRAEIDAIAASGRHAVLDIDLEGARQLRRSVPDSVHVFILPPSAAALVARLTGRNTEAPEVVERRLRRAAEEIAAAAEYHYVVPNDDLDQAVREVGAIIDAESRRTDRHDRMAERLAALRHDVEEAVHRLAAANAVK